MEEAPKQPNKEEEIGDIPQDPYEALGVNRDASTEDIDKAYKKAARKYHPDKNPGDKKAEEWFMAAAEARDLLLEPEKNAGKSHYFRSSSSTPSSTQHSSPSFTSGFGVPFEDIFGSNRKDPRTKAERDGEERSHQERKRKDQEQRAAMDEIRRQQAEAARARYEKEEKRRQQEQVEREQEAKRKQEEKQTKVEIEALKDNLLILSNRYKDGEYFKIEKKYDHLAPLYVKGGPLEKKVIHEDKAELESKIDITLTKLAEKSGVSLEEMKSDFYSKVEEHLKKREISLLNFFKSTLERKVKELNFEINKLEEDLGIFKGDTPKYKVRIQSSRSGMEEFLRKKGMWPGLDKPRKELEEKQAEMTKVEEGIKEVEETLSTFK